MHVALANWPLWIALWIAVSPVARGCRSARAPLSREILVFVGLREDRKQCCDCTKVDCSRCAG